jgi:C1A family cysteine protease
LRALGYYNAPTTGYFEQLTREAVIQFQKQDMTDAATTRAAPDASCDARSPDGIFDVAAMKQLYGDAAREIFQFLESPTPQLLIEGIIRQFGGPEAVLAELIEKDVKPLTQTIEGIQAIAEKLTKELENPLPSDENKLKVAECDENRLKVAELSGIIANPNKSESDKQEAVKQLILLMAKLAINPIVQAIAQLVAPIGKYTDVERACEDGVRRFKVFANFSRVKEIDRILKGVSSWKFDELASWKFDELEPQLNQYEQLAETLATIQLEAKRYKRSLQIAGPNINLIDLSRSLVIKAIKAINPTPLAAADSILRKIQEFLIRRIYVNVKNYAKPPENSQTENLQTIVDALIDEPLQTKVVREQTFIRVVPSCNACLLQVPVAGKLYKPISGSLKQFRSVYLVLPSAVDLSLWCSPVEDQGSLDACTAHAGVALFEYFQKKSSGNSTDASRRFLYKVTRNLMHREGDTGASVRETMKAMVLFGIPPEEYCPYDEDKFDDDPPAFCYAFAQNFQAITYFRLDDAGISAQELLAQIKTLLVAGFPCMFGFTVYDSIHDRSNPPGHIPYPDLNNKREGGHAAIVVGYDDYRQIARASNSGALLVKNSWGKTWGEGGYGWLPYDYVLKGLARDWWSLVKSEWVETEQFGLGSEDNWISSMGDGKGTRS